MEQRTELAERLEEGLRMKRQNLAVWLATAPAKDKEIRLGPAGEQQVHDHLHVVDDVLERAAGGFLGVCSICGELVDDEMLEMDYTAQVCLDHFTTVEVRQLERELELSSVVQRALLPQRAPEIPGLEVAAFSRAAQIVSGDFFDFLPLNDGQHGLLIADVAGKGMSASLIMASIQTALRTLAPTATSPAHVLRDINRLFARNIRLSTFITLFLGAYDPSTRTLTYCNSGHNPPLLLRHGEEHGPRFLWLDPTGAAIGLIENPRLRDETVELFPGDLLLLYTDGVVEAFDPAGETYGLERLTELLRGNGDLPPQELIQVLWHDLSAFAHGRPMADDVTIIACRLE
ncbi:MAG TPA: SpoIIE family protein phosphatase [Anaerolineae bacterium]|nr:SpoIIE family protein phosphatase [Anaerolineae bacterium]